MQQRALPLHHYRCRYRSTALPLYHWRTSALRPLMVLSCSLDAAA